MNVEFGSRLIAKVARKLSSDPEVIAMLQKQERKARIVARRRDFVWYSLVSSAGTLGGVAKSKEMMRAKNYRAISYSKLLRMKNRKARIAQLNSTLKKFNIHYPDRKSVQLAKNLEMIESRGGLLAIKKYLWGLPGRDAKMDFLMLFAGVGPKYARNIMMVAKDSDFENSIATDSRILTICEKVGLNFRKRPVEAEPVLLNVAREAGISGWQLDRMMFWFDGKFVSGINDLRAQSKALAARA